MKWLLPVIVSVLLVLLFVTPQGERLRLALLDLQGSGPVAESARTGEASENDSDDADDDDDDVPSRLVVRDGVMGISLTPETQAISGLRTRPAEAMQYREEIQALAEVVTIKPLLDLRVRSHNLRAEIDLSEVALRRSREAYKRLELLHRDNANISARQLEEARARLQTDEARLASQQQQLRSLRTEAIQSWGETLAGWALDENSILFERLVNRQEALLLLTLTQEQTLPPETRVIYINRNDNRVAARKAYLVSAAPRIEPGLQGETYYFRTQADRLRIGMRTHAWIPVSGELIEGIHAPAQAVVRQAGQPWIYLKQGESFFYRRSLDKPVKLSNGWFIPADQVAPGTEIVTTGAQMLLSEEYRWQIPDEDDDV